MAHGHIAHLEIAGDDLERVNAFYSGVFGWQIGPIEGMPDYEMANTGQEAIGAGLGIRDKTAPSATRIYITVDSIEAALVKVAELGGSLVVDKTEVPGMGHFAAVNDSEGNEIGLWEELAA